MNDTSPRNVSLAIRSQPSELAGVRRQVEQFALEAGLSQAAASRVELAVDEALTNVIRHAYEGRSDGQIDIHLRREACWLQVVIRDYGREVDPATIRARDLDDVRPGGLGVHIIGECMDTAVYAPAEGGGTVLTLRKNLDGTNE